MKFIYSLFMKEMQVFSFQISNSKFLNDNKIFFILKITKKNLHCKYQLFFITYLFFRRLVF